MLDNSKCQIPENLYGGLKRYVEHGIPTGDFLRAVLLNDLKEACMRADQESAASLHAIVDFLYNEVPGPCWGTAERVLAWIEHKGLSGL